MTKTEHLLVQIMEECDEVSQRAAKALRFGLRETQQGNMLNNQERIASELSDLVGVCEELGIVPTPSLVEAKRRKVRKYLRYAKMVGTLQAARG